MRTFQGDDAGVTSDTPQMRWGNPARVHAEGNIAAVSFRMESAQYEYGAKWLRALLGTPWTDKRGSGERGLAMSDMAVLTRTRKQMVPVAAALRAIGLDVMVRGEDSLLIPPEAEALATAADFLAGCKTTPPSRGGRGGPTISPVTEEDVRQAVQAAGLAVTAEDAACGSNYLARLKMSPSWNKAVCLIEVMEEFLLACGYHVALDGESNLYPAPLGGKQVRREQQRSGEIAWQAITRVMNAAADFQRFGFTAPLSEKASQFAEWLRIEAPAAYKGDEFGGGSDGLRVTPDAVCLLTAHAAKGLEWPAVWLPDLTDGRFPLRTPPTGSKIWDILPLTALTPAQARRADGEDGESDRLAYVAATRAEAYLLGTYAPPPKWKKPRPSLYFNLIADHHNSVRDGRILPESSRRGARRLEPSPRRETRTITVTFSQLFVYWMCPRAFYLRFLVGFPPPIVPELGYGESLHRSAREVHERVRCGEHLSEEAIEEIVLRHFHLPFADERLTADLRDAAVRALTAYYKGYHAEDDGTVVHTEQEIRLDLGQITLIGRIDLTTVLADGDTVLAEVKTENAPSSERELYAYGLGYESGTGDLPTWVETRQIRADGADGSGEPERKRMNATVAEETRASIREVGEAMRGGHFPMVPVEEAPAKCRRCDVRLVCVRGQNSDAEVILRRIGTT